jgi:hypothetical protein
MNKARQNHRCIHVGKVHLLAGIKLDHCCRGLMQLLARRNILYIFISSTAENKPFQKRAILDEIASSRHRANDRMHSRMAIHHRTPICKTSLRRESQKRSNRCRSDISTGSRKCTAPRYKKTKTCSDRNGDARLSLDILGGVWMSS